MPAPIEPKLEFAFTVKITLEQRYWVKPTDTGGTRAGIYLKDLRLALPSRTSI